MNEDITSSTKELFFNNIAHEFRTPLSLILGPTEQLLNSLDDPIQQQKLILIRRNALYLKQLIDQLLALSKMDDGHDSYHFHKIKLQDFFSNLLSPFSDLAEMHNIKFKIRQDFNDAVYYGDSIKWSIVINNLVSNAIKFTPEGGKVSVLVKVVNKMLSISVKDTGIGIAAKKIPHVFDRYYQEQKHINHYIGTGIGLALCKEISDQLNAEIYVESVAGHGSTFYWNLPLYESEEEVLENYPTAVFTENPEDDKKTLKETNQDYLIKAYHIDENTENDVVLIAEDNVELRKLLVESLSKFEIIEASNGQEAIELAIKYIPKIVITDLMMPDVDGFELIELLGSDFRTSHIPIIVTSALSDIQHRINALDKGASAFINKPFNLKEVELHVSNLIKISNLEIEKRGNNWMEYKNNLSKVEQEFVQNMNSVIDDSLDEEHFNVEELSGQLGISRVQLHRKVKVMCGCSAAQYIKKYKLAQAAEWLNRGGQTISEIAFRLGYSSLAHFSRSFKKEFGLSPKDFKSQNV